MISYKKIKHDHTSSSIMKNNAHPMTSTSTSSSSTLQQLLFSALIGIARLPKTTASWRVLLSSFALDDSTSSLPSPTSLAEAHNPPADHQRRRVLHAARFRSAKLTRSCEKSELELAKKHMHPSNKHQRTSKHIKTQWRTCKYILKNCSKSKIHRLTL